jgi:hypothetical protein
MTRAMKLAVLFGVLAAGVLFASESWASILPAPSDPYQIPINDPSNADSWARIPTIEQQDKDWTWVSNTANLNLVPATFQLVVSDGIDNHKLQLADAGSNVTLPSSVNNYQLVYTIAVTAGNPLVFITEATLGVDYTPAHLNNRDIDVTKTLYDINDNIVGELEFKRLTAGNVVIDDTDILLPNLKFVKVVEDIHIGVGFVNSITDTFIQTIVIPEPASIIVWSLIGSGSWLGMRLWRRRRVAASSGNVSSVAVTRHPWSPEARQAIHDIITRGVPR